MPPPQTIVAAHGRFIFKKTLLRTRQFIDDYGLVELLPECNEIKFEVGSILKGSDLKLWQAHDTWSQNGFGSAATPDGFSRQEAGVAIPKNLRKLGACCIIKRSGGMGSHFGFVGTYVSMLVFFERQIIWDTRYCDAN